jgi:protein subunit release factor B
MLKSVFLLRPNCRKIIERLKFTLNEDEIDEIFARGSGPGGQSINKSKNKVQLIHRPTGISVSCQDFRDLTSNRKHARTMLLRKIDLSMNGEFSVIGKKIAKARKKKAKSSQRAKVKYGKAESTVSITNNNSELSEE